MIIFPTAAGPLLCLSPQDLPAGQPLTDDTLLPLVRRALIQREKEVFKLISTSKCSCRSIKCYNNS